jgi:hypothetical protein
MKQFKFDVILLNQVLEHAEDIEQLCQRVQCLLTDNGFRPDVQEVMTLFNRMNLIRGEVITDHTFLYYLGRLPQFFIFQLLRFLAPFYRFRKWKDVILPKFKYFNRSYRVNCVVLKNNR